MRTRFAAAPRLLLAALPLAMVVLGFAAGTRRRRHQAARPSSTSSGVAPTSRRCSTPTRQLLRGKGENREVRIFFQDEAGGQGEEYLRLRIDAPTLLARPDGTPIAEGDSVLITSASWTRPSMLFELEPSGLTFNPLQPAELKIHYDHADGDLNDDGSVDGDGRRRSRARWRSGARRRRAIRSSGWARSWW